MFFYSTDLKHQTNLQSYCALGHGIYSIILFVLDLCPLIHKGAVTRSQNVFSLVLCSDHYEFNVPDEVDIEHMYSL